MSETINPIDAMIFQIYDKIVNKKQSKKQRKITINQFFVKQYKQGYYRDFNKVTLSSGDQDKVIHYIAQVNWKLLEDTELEQVRSDYKDFLNAEQTIDETDESSD